MGCTGSPADSHDIRWYTIHKDKLLRCGECGSGEFSLVSILDPRLLNY